MQTPEKVDRFKTFFRREVRNGWEIERAPNAPGRNRDAGRAAKGGAGNLRNRGSCRPEGTPAWARQKRGSVPKPEPRARAQPEPKP